MSLADLQRRRADLRDDLDLARRITPPRGSGAQRSARQLRAAIRAGIDRFTVRIRKLRRATNQSQPSVVYTKISPNQSSRGGVTPRLIVLHDTESHEQQGNGDLVAIANYFASTSAQASSHVITDRDGHSARCVEDADKAWTQVAFNSVSLSIEQIGFATYSAPDWSSAHRDETARWIALWSRKYGIPIQRGAVSGSTVTRSGIVTHEQLGSAGGGHHDPGPQFPLDDVLARAKRFA